MVNYVNEVDENKRNVLLINKSDFLTERQRLEWLRYFESKSIHAIFWSAAMELNLTKPNAESEDESETSSRNRTNSHQSEMSNESETTKSDGFDDINEDDEDEAKTVKPVNRFNVLSEESPSLDEESEDNDDDETNNESEEEENEEDSEKTNDLNDEENSSEQKLEKIKESNETSQDLINLSSELEKLNMTDDERQKCRILNREELVAFFKTVHKSPDKVKPGFNTIGLVGYPNVGKSSTINALFMNKKVAVSETPGKTKHYQTLFIDDELMLCDCPGLVFPSFVSTKGELIINGILPIDQMREYMEPINQISFFLLILNLSFI